MNGFTTAYMTDWVGGKCDSIPKLFTYGYLVNLRSLNTFVMKPEDVCKVRVLSTFRQKHLREIPFPDAIRIALKTVHNDLKKVPYKIKIIIYHGRKKIEIGRN